MKIIKEFILRELADEYILIPVGSTTEQFNGLMTLSETGAFIYKHIEEAKDFNDLIDLILNEYDIDKDTASQDAVYFINQLLKTGIITLSNPNNNW